MIALLLATLLFLTTDAFADTWFVAKTGSDSVTCTQAQNQNTPKLTIHAALLCVGGDDTSGSGANDTVTVDAGIYDEEFYNVIPGGFSDTARFTLQAAVRGAVTLRPAAGGIGLPGGDCGANPCRIISNDFSSYVTIDGFIMDASNTGFDAVKLYGNYWTIQYSELYNPAAQCVYTEGSHHKFLHLTVHKCGHRDPTYHPGQGGHNDFYIPGSFNEIAYTHIYDSGAGINYFHDVLVPSNNVAHHNILERTATPGNIGEGGGIGLYGPNNSMYANLCIGCSLFVGAGCSNCLVYNNTVYNNISGGTLWLYGGATNTIVQNNIFYPVGIFNDGTNPGTVLSNNVTTNPLFVNEALGGGNFHLQSSSPARDTGVTIDAFPSDLDDVARPQGCCYDVGAYEFR